MIQILILGGAGFLGKQISNFLKDKAKIVIFDKKKLDGIESRIVNVSDLKELKKNYLDFNFDIVIDLINTQGITKTRDNFNYSYQTNIITLKNIIKCCSINKAKLIYTSSAAVYGITKKIPIDENFDLNPVNEYGFFKEFSENIIINEFNINYTILRIFNIYTKEKGFGIINHFFECIEEKKKINLFGINQLRDYIHIEDLLNIIYKVCLNQKTNNQILNVGSGKGISTKEILDIFLKYYDIKYNIEEIEIEYNSVANISKIKKIINFKPKNIIEELKIRLKND